jgi:hypothetical protein
MAGFIPTEGETMVANLLFKGASVDRGTDMSLGLFTNSAPSTSLTAATLTEPTGGSYARKTLTDGSWTVASGVATYAKQTFTVTSTDYTGTVHGYFIVSKGTTPRIVQIEVDPNGPYALLVGDNYDITPSITLS